MSANISPPESTPAEDPIASKHINGTEELIMTPDLLFKLNKKVAQLTKVVYGLNTRGEDLESQLIVSKENEEKVRNLNAELQYRVNNFKAKIEAEMGKLKELEAQATQGQYWKREFENLQRRFEAEQFAGSDGRCLLDASQQLEEHQRREEALEYELEQAKHTVVNLKTHQDFIMKERDGQAKLEREKIILEWQTRVTDVEGRYKSQLRRAAEEIKVMSEECSSLRMRIANVNESGLREQIMAMQLAFDKEKKDFLREIRQKSEEMELERTGIIELQRKLHVINEEKRKIEDKRDEELSASSDKYEAKITELQNKYEILQELDNSREQELELKLKTKLLEWRSDRDEVEEGYRTELRNLRSENDQLDIEIKTMRSSANKTGTDLSQKVKKLEGELSERTREVEMKAKNFKVRINMLETKNTQLSQEKTDFKNKMESELERFRQVNKAQETLHEQVIYDLKEQMSQAEESEEDLRDQCKDLEVKSQALHAVNDELKLKIREAEREGEVRYQKEKEKLEVKVKQNVERTWKERMQIAEDLAANELLKFKEEWKKKEETLANEVANMDKMKEEAKRGSEELRKKIREMRQQELETSKKQNVIENELKSWKREDEANIRKLKEVETQATRYQHQIDQLTVKLTKEQQIVFQLRQDLEDAQKAAKLHKQELDETKKQNSSMTSLEIRIQDLSRQLREKEAITESVRVDLQYEKSESVACKAKMKKLEEDLSNSEKNVQKLERQSANKNQDSGKVGDLELKIKSLEEKLIQSESTRRNHETTLAEIEEEREDEMKIVQDALDEAAREREELIKTFNKELDHANTMNTAREQQMLDDFEWKLREMQKENKETLDEMEKQAENTIQKKKPNEDDEYKLKLEKAKKEINSEWEDRHRQECARLKVCLESKYEQERETAVTDLRSQKEQEHQAIKMAHETKEKETAKEMANLRQLLKDKEANHQMETENNRTCSDRDICELRMKLQRLSDSSYDKEQNMIEKHSEELERLRIDYNERIKEMHARIEDYEARIGIDTIAKMNEEHGKQMEHLREQHMISMERLREESESDKFQCVEEARLALTNHYEQLSTSFREKLSESDIQISQYKNELQIATELANKRKETMQDYQGQLERLKQIQSLGSSLPAVTSGSSGLITEFSLESQSYNGSQDSHTSQDTGSSSDSGHEDSHKNGGGSLLGKVFGGGWFQSQKTRRGSMPLTNKKAY